MVSRRAHTRLGVGGQALWDALSGAHELDAAQQVTLLEACRAKDRLDGLDRLLCGNVSTWAELVVDVNSDGQVFELRITNALDKANTTANLMKQLLAALRLPDAVGKRPQARGGARGAYAAQAPGRVSSLDRARAASAS